MNFEQPKFSQIEDKKQASPEEVSKEEGASEKEGGNAYEREARAEEHHGPDGI